MAEHHNRTTFEEHTSVIAQRREMTGRRCALVALTLALVALLVAGCSVVGGGASSVPATRAHATARPTTTAPVTMVNWSAPLHQPAVAASMQFGFTSAPSDPQIAYACVGDSISQTTQQRFYKSVDGAQTWQPVNVAPNPGLPCAVFIDPQNVNDIFLQQVLLQPTGDGAPISASFWRSQDGGATWAQLPLPPNSYGWSDLVIAGHRLIGAYLPVVFGATQCNNAIFSQPVTSNLLASDDGGHTWFPLGQTLASQRIGLTGVISAGTRLFASGETPQTACDQTVYRTYWQSTDGGDAWTATTLPANTNIVDMSFTAAASGHSYLGVAVEQPNFNPSGANGAPSTLLVSDDSGASWRPAPQYTGAQLTAANVQFLNVARTPAGDVVIGAQLLPGPDTSCYLYLVRLHNGAPGWFQYTPGAISYEIAWQILPTAHGEILQAIGYDPNQPHAVATIPLPA